MNVLFNLVEKHSPVSFLGLNALVQLCCVHCARFDILSLFFSETKCKPAKKTKKIQGECFTTSSKSTCKNLGTFEGKQILPEKVTSVPLAPSHSIVSTKPKLITLPGGDQARHRVLQLLLHSQYKAHPRGLTEYGTGNNKRLHQSYYTQSPVLVI